MSAHVTMEVDDDALQRILDSGSRIVLFRNRLGSYTALVTETDEQAGLVEDAVQLAREVGPHITDRFSPSEAVQAIAEKLRERVDLWDRETNDP